MVNQRFLKIIYLFVCVVITAGCATVNIPNAGQEGYQLQDDERRLFKRSEELSEALDESGAIYNNAALEQYLNHIANDLLSAEIKEEGIVISVKVLNDPGLNAFSLPNGRIYIHTGMLAIIENETQLASLLGHEITHVIHRHALKQFRSLTNKSAFLSVMAIPATVAGGQLGGIFVQLTSVSSVYGYSKDLEFEADQIGFNMLTNRGYDAHEALKLFEHLHAYLLDENIKEPFFFSTHPKVMARIQNYNKFIDQVTPSTSPLAINFAQFEMFINDLILTDIELCLQAGLFKTGERVVARYISRNPMDYRGFFNQGELFRKRQDAVKGEKKRDKETDYALALESYDNAIARDTTFALSYEGKARIFEKQKKMDDAKINFKKYMELNPQASDRAFVEQFLEGKN